jgi:hypothetical protein
MAYFDIITAATKAYKKSWEERRYLVKLAAVPFFVKLVCFTLAATFAQGEGTYLRFMLIMLPALMVEGWMLSHFTRLLVLNQRWPFQPSGDFDADMDVLAVRARGVLSGMIVFVLINMSLGFLTAIVGQYLLSFLPAAGASPDTVNVPPQAALLSIFMVAFMFWGFRLLWLYIPYALNMTIKDYLLPLRGLSSSLHMIGIWLLCFVPFFLALRLLAGIIAGPVQLTFGEQAASFIIIILTVLADTLKSLLTTAGITYGLYEVFQQKKPQGR